MKTTSLGNVIAVNQFALLSKVLHEVHAFVKMRDLIAVAVQQKRLPFTEFANANFGGLTPTRMRHVRVHVGIKTVLAWTLDIPGRRRLIRHQRDLHDRLDALETILPRHDQPNRRAMLRWQYGFK